MDKKKGRCGEVDKQIYVAGMTFKSYEEIGEHYGISENIIRMRLMKGWSLDEIVSKRYTRIDGKDSVNEHRTLSESYGIKSDTYKPIDIGDENDSDESEDRNRHFNRIVQAIRFNSTNKISISVRHCTSKHEDNTNEKQETENDIVIDGMKFKDTKEVADYYGISENTMIRYKNKVGCSIEDALQILVANRYGLTDLWLMQISDRDISKIWRKSKVEFKYARGK